MKSLINYKILNITFIITTFICCICLGLKGFISNNLGAKILSFFSSCLFGISSLLRVVRIIKLNK